MDMDPLSITANVVGIAAFCGQFIKILGRFVIDTRETPGVLADFYSTITALKEVVEEIERLPDDQAQQLPSEADHRRRICRIARLCNDTVERLKRLLPEARDDPGAYDKIRANVELSLQKNTVRQIVGHISSYTQVLQLSISTLALRSLWETRRSQDQIQTEIRRLTDAIRSREFLPPRGDPTRAPTSEDLETDAVTNEILAWSRSADDLAAAVSEYEPDQMSLNARSLGADTITDSGIDVNFQPVEQDDFDPEPDLDDCPSRDVLQCHLEENQKMVRHFKLCGIFGKAATSQRRSIEWRQQLAAVHSVDFPYDDRADMQEYLAEILMEAETVKSTCEAKDILEQLLLMEVARGPDGTDQARRCRLYHKLGCLYMRQGNLKQAQKSLRRAFEGRNKIQPPPRDLIIESLDALVQALRLGQAMDEVRGYLRWKEQAFPSLEQQQQSLLPDGSAAAAAAAAAAGDAGLSSAFSWSKERGFPVDAPHFSFEARDPAKGTSPLHVAIQDENLDVFQHMVAHVVSLGLDLEQRDDADKATPLLVAAATRNRETTRVLLEKGARVDVVDRRGMTPLHRCQSKSGGLQVAEELLKGAHRRVSVPQQQRQQQQQPTMTTTAGPGLSGTTINTTAAFDLLNAVDDTGRTALHMAVEKGNGKMLVFLLKKGASPDLAEKRGKTALYMACEKGDDHMVRSLLEGGARPDVPGPRMCTPLIAAIDTSFAINIKVTMVKDLLFHGAKPSVEDEDGRTAYQAARKASFSSEIRRLLLQADAKRTSSSTTATGSDLFRLRTDSFASSSSSKRS